MASGYPADDREASANSPFVNEGTWAAFGPMVPADGYRVRMALPSDLVAVADLFDNSLRMSDVDDASEVAGIPQRPDWHPRASALAAHLFETGDVGSLLAKQRNGVPGSLLAELTVAALSQSFPAVLAGLSLVFVAVDRHERVVGAMVTGPPVALMRAVMHAGGDRYQSMAVAALISRIEGVAVAEYARNRGIGTAMLLHAIHLYDRAGYMLMYGSVTGSMRLRQWYERAGFTVLLAGRFELKPLLGIDTAITADSGEGLAMRRRR